MHAVHLYSVRLASTRLGRLIFLSLLLSLFLVRFPHPVAAQAHDTHPQDAETAQAAHDDHRMYRVTLGSGWTLAAMAQIVPLFSRIGGLDGEPLDRSQGVLTQGALMANLESPGGRWVLRVTPHFEPFTLEDGELTPGGWGEGFLDFRHPHTFLHEVMVSRNHRAEDGWSWSVSGGKGFAPFGSDDPMGRPSAKYPTNHHLAQILERFTLNGLLSNGDWVLEAGVFGGSEPDGPHDLSNWKSFGNSQSARVTRIVPSGDGMGKWELSLSAARILTSHEGEDERTLLFHSGARWDDGRRSLLIEAARSRVEDQPVSGYYSVLAEGKMPVGPVHAYMRAEYATRPEYPRGSGDEGYFRYSHHAHPVGASRWQIGAVGVEASEWLGSVLVRPFVEGAVQRASRVAGTIDPRLPLDQGFTLLTVGVRVFPGGGPMRMGSYGLRDDMSRMLIPAPGADPGAAPHH